LSRLGQVGYVMSLFYDIHYNKLYDSSIYYSYYVNQYVNDLNKWRQMYKNKKIKTCTFNKKSTYMKESYYLFHYKEKSIKNDIHIDKNIIITGPNASGKTTLLKSILLNIILSQQIGFGSYKKANIHVYDYLHSYLNIPDTSDRDSLFQAEARRCKDILETINSHEKERHFCIFDELYSGTNPNDAVLCATLYLKGLIQHKNHIDFVLTTHYIKLCEYFNDKTYEKDLVNIKMDVNVENEDIDYLYKIKHGISYVHGGKKVLKDLEYPSYLYEL
jgi:DNA mismatch repair ATPase MutS